VPGVFRYLALTRAMINSRAFDIWKKSLGVPK
jgi:hypothetical protein